MTMFDNVINLTYGNFINHKNDKIFFQTEFFTSKLFIFITKMYKIVKIYNNNLIYILDLYDFCAILASGYRKINFLSFPIKKLICIINNKRDFSLFYKKNEVFKLPYYKSKVLINTIKQFYFSYIINKSNLAHIINKKIEVNSIIHCIKEIEKRNCKTIMLKKVMKKSFFNTFNCKCDSNLMNHCLVYYYLDK